MDPFINLQQKFTNSLSKVFNMFDLEWRVAHNSDSKKVKKLTKEQ